MISKINKYLVGLFISCTVITSCDSDDTDAIFEQTATERINSRVQELRTLLKSQENGWEFVYFPNNDEVGGFTFVFKFIDDQNVEMTSDFDDDTMTIVSNYDVLVGSTIKLSFTTKNDLHKLADGGNPPDNALIGRGFFGDFEFLYYGTEGENLRFRPNRTFEDDEDSRGDLFFRPASTTSFDDVNLNRDIFRSIRFNPVFSEYEINENGSISSLIPSFNFNRRILTLTDPITNNTSDVAFAYTKEGLEVNPPIEIGNQNFTKFTYDAENNSFNSEGLSGNNAIAIKFFNEPKELTDDNLTLVGEENNGYGFISENLLGNSSPLFNIDVELLDANIREIGFELARVQLFFNNTNLIASSQVNFIQYRLTNLSDGTTINVVHLFDYDTSEKGVIKLIPGEWDIDDDLIPLFDPIDKVLTDEKGLFVKSESFTVRFTNTIFSFTSVDKPNFQMLTYAFQ